MGNYLNPTNYSFEESLNTEIFIDKSQLISFTNTRLRTKNKFLCVSRPRRFGKTMAAEMLAAYYAFGMDSSKLFDGLKISKEPNYKEYLNQFHVLKVDMKTFMTIGKNIEGLISTLTAKIVRDIKKAYPEIDFFDESCLQDVLATLCDETNKQIVFIIDEWDCPMRILKNPDEHRFYLDFLRNLLKDQPYVALGYMTGILPVKHYGEHSTLNMFREYSILDSANISDCFGFTEEEVKDLCIKYNRDFEETKAWYDGYKLWIGEVEENNILSIYSPNSIVESINRRKFAGYWNATETFDALRKYIVWNMDGLKDSVINMLAGNPVSLNILGFSNDMSTFYSKDDILTLLIHLGYLGYNPQNKTVAIPNKEVTEEFLTSIEKSPEYAETFKSIDASKKLLEALWNKEAEVVAEGVDKVHLTFDSIHYNNENSLSCVVELAFFYAREYYLSFRELPTGKGFADICYIPRPNHQDKPAVLIELKWDKTVETAIDQIKNNQYPSKLEPYKDKLIVCAINYDKNTKLHSCQIGRLGQVGSMAKS